MGARLNLLDLGDDLLHLIVIQLQIDSPSSILPFAKVSKVCKEVAIPVLYRSITLKDGGTDAEMVLMKQLVKNLLNPDHELAKHVKDITVVEFGRFKEPWSLGASELEGIIANIKYLSCFRWNTTAWIPERVLSKLEKQHSTAKLYVTNHDRNQYKARERKMDTRLLSSPLLYSLSYSLCWGWTDDGAQKLCSELHQISTILTKSPRLRFLDIGFYNSPESDKFLPARTEDRVASSTQLPLQFQLPKLHSLKIPAQYAYSTSSPVSITKLTCALLTQCTNWARIQRLHLHGLCPKYVFEQLEGRVPNVKRLDIALKTTSDSEYLPVTFNDSAPVKDFIMSIKGLEELRIKNHDAAIHFLWPAIIQHRDSLRSLIVHTIPDHRFRRGHPPYWRSKQLEELVGSRIEYLELDVSVNEVSKFSGTTTFESTLSQLQNLRFQFSRPSVLSRLGMVRKLKLWIELPFEASPFSVEYKYDGTYGSVRCPPLEEKEAKKAAIGLLKEMRKDPVARIEELELCFVRLDIEDRMQSWTVQWPVCVTRLKTEDGKVRGGLRYESDCGKSWTGCA